MSAFTKLKQSEYRKLVRLEALGKISVEQQLRLNDLHAERYWEIVSKNPLDEIRRLKQSIEILNTLNGTLMELVDAMKGEHFYGKPETIENGKANE